MEAVRQASVPPLTPSHQSLLASLYQLVPSPLMPSLAQVVPPSAETSSQPSSQQLSVSKMCEKLSERLEAAEASKHGLMR